MSATGKATGRSGLAALLCLGVLLVGVGLTLTAGDAPFVLDLPVLAALLALVPAYVIASRVTLDFEVRGESHSMTVSQVLLAIGVLTVAAPVHLAARLVATLVAGALDRQRPTKLLFNLSVGALEVGLTSLAVSLVHTDRPGLALWLALFAGLLVSEVLSSLALSAVWAVLRMPLSRSQVLRPLALGIVTSTAFTGMAVVGVSAVWAEPWSAVVVLALVTAATLAYRNFRRLAAERDTTSQLYAFVRDLGPVDVDEPGALQVLEEVRVLLHAEHLDLALTQPDGGWLRLRAAEGAAPALLKDTTPPSPPDSPAPTASSQRRALSTDMMSTAMVGQAGVAGLLTARGRLGAVRDFDLGDLRLFEAVATELATAVERGRLLADLRRTATTDLLTGLPNLGETNRHVEDLLAAEQGVVLAVVAVDSFREVNETLGHQTGDALLREVARRLRSAQPDAIIGRAGGGRFAVAMGNQRGELSPELFGLELRTQVEGPVHIGMVGTHVRLSVGVVHAPEHGDDAPTLLRRAEIAVDGARRARGGPVVWAPAYEVQGQRRVAVVSALRTALAAEEIGVVYQPKIDARTGAPTGVEALARWTHPALGAISPAEFVPLAEAGGLMGALTRSVLRQSLAACRGWQRRAGAVGVSVNVSADTVLDPGFITEVDAALKSSGAEPGLLTLELTEDVLVADPGLAATRMDELHALGVRLSVDDFGSGYSSLTYLKRLPIDEVKLDKAFIDGVVTDAADRSVISAVVNIAHTLGMRVVAEGVEHPDQHDALRALGVDELQGYLHARPMPALSVAGWLRQREHSAR